VAELKFVVMPDSPINGLRDFKGKRLGYTNPQSSTQMLELLLLEQAGLSPSDITMIATGGFGPGVTALEHGGLDIAPISEPPFTLSNGRYKVVLRGSDAFPPIGNGVAITSAKTARERPEVLRGILAARRKAVAFVYSNPTETAEIAAKPYGLDAKTLESIIRDLIAQGEARHFRYFPEGGFDWTGMNLMAHALNLVGIVKGPVDWSTMVDESFLPDDLKTKK
jgi:NitT/TauT family transport system substrate-binding protein